MSEIDVKNLRKLPPSYRNKALRNLHFDGKLCVSTVCSGKYLAFIPMFVHCMRTEFPGVDCRIYVHGQYNFLEYTPEEYECLIGLGCVYAPEKLAFFPGDGLTTAALRFVYSDKKLEEYDYVLITDVDMMMFAEPDTIQNYHMRSLTLNGTECYDNYNQISNVKPRLPGVHFATKDWWGRTRDMRSECMSAIETAKLSWGHDEFMLGQIVLKSGLPMPTTEQHLWAHHGLHIGSYRKALADNCPLRHPGADKAAFAQRLASSEEFMGLVQNCSKHLPWVADAFKFFSGTKP